MAESTLTELRAALAKVEATLQSGVTKVTVDGTTTEVDVESLRKERRELRRKIDAKTGNMRRPFITQVNLGGF